MVQPAFVVWNNGSIDWIASNPLAGDVIQGSGGCRKVRWSRSAMGKRGGARIMAPRWTGVVVDRLYQD